MIYLKLKPTIYLQLILLLGLLLPAALPAVAQEKDSAATAITVGLHSHYGFIIPHASELRHIADSHPWGLELDMSFHFTDKKAWQYLQGYPRLGASLAYFNFDNPEVLGNAYSLIVFAEPFLSAHKDFSLSFRLGTGISYMDTPHHPETNPENLFYSTAISFPLVANIMANYRLNEYLLLRAGASYHHISNGGINQPNKGINYPTITTGLNYALRPASFPERQSAEGIETGDERNYLITLFGSATNSPQNPSKHIPLVGLTAYMSQRIGRLSAFTAGAEWVADFALSERIKEDEEEEISDFQRGALLLGHELRIGSIRFSQQLGIYVYAPYPAMDRVYQRYGLEYHTRNKFFFGFNLKAHRHVADFLDARIGLRF